MSAATGVSVVRVHDVAGLEGIFEIGDLVIDNKETGGIIDSE